MPGADRHGHDRPNRPTSARQGAGTAHRPPGHRHHLGAAPPRPRQPRRAAACCSARSPIAPVSSRRRPAADPIGRLRRPRRDQRGAQITAAEGYSVTQCAGGHPAEMTASATMKPRHRIQSCRSDVQDAVNQPDANDLAWVCCQSVSPVAVAPTLPINPRPKASLDASRSPAELPGNILGRVHGDRCRDRTCRQRRQHRV